MESPAGTIVLCCHYGLASHADFVLRIVARLADRLADGFRVQFGWSLLTVRREGGEWVIYEPDFGGDPIAGLRRDTTLTLRVQAEMNAMLARCKVDTPDYPLYTDTVVTRKGALRAPRAYLLRSPRTGANDSGWFLGLPDEEVDPGVVDDVDRYEVVAVCGLVAVRPEFAKVLALPAGYVAVFRGRDVEAIEGPEDR